MREQRDVIDADEFNLNVTELSERTDELLAVRPTHEPNRRLLKHLENEREHMFTFPDRVGCSGDQLAGRAGAACRDRQPQELGREPNLAGSAHPVDRDERDPYRPPARHRPARADGQRAQRSRQPAASNLIRLPARASPASQAA